MISVVPRGVSNVIRVFVRVGVFFGSWRCALDASFVFHTG
jgi:hypothetical protein